MDNDPGKTPIPTAQATPTGAALVAPDVPEPAPVAEAGVSTSEWKVLVAYAAQLAAAETSTLAVKYLGATLSPEVLQAAVSFEFLGTAAVVSYIIGRSIRKHGTTA